MADWQWQLELTDEDARKSRLLAAATAAGAVACGVVFAITQDRYWIVVTLMLASICWFGRSATARLRSLRATVEGPLLSLVDRRETTTIDLRDVDRIEVRRRSSSTGSHRWVIEATGADTVELHHLPNLEMYLGLSEQAIEPLRSAVEHYHRWYQQDGLRQAPSAADTATAVMTPLTRSVTGGFEWRPPRRPNAERNQRRVLIFTLAAAAAIAALAIQQNWGDTTGIILSLVIIPPLVLLLGLGCWYAYTPGKRFRLTVSDGELQTWRGDKLVARHPLAGVTNIVVDVAHARNHSTNTNTSHPYVRLFTGPTFEQVALPTGLGLNLDAEARVALERELRRHAGLV